jgi:hypothetical protein
MSWFHAGCGCPGLARSASLRTWWTSTVPSACLHSSHRPVWSRVTSSFRRTVTGAGMRSVRTAFFLAPQWNPTEPCDQWFATFAFDADLETSARPGRCGDGGLVAVRHLGHRRVVLAGQRLEHGGLHHPFKPVQSVDVPGQQVVRHQPPVLRAVGPDDRVVVFVDHSVEPLGFAELEVGGALGLDHVAGHPQADGAVDGTAGAGDLVVGVLNDDLVAEEPGRARSGVGDQCFLLRQFQLEFLTQERRKTDLDFLGFGLRSGEPEEVVVAVPHVVQPPEPRINRGLARQTPPLLAQRTHRGTVPSPACPCE